jgi:hypothetical protein
MQRRKKAVADGAYEKIIRPYSRNQMKGDLLPQEGQSTLHSQEFIFVPYTDQRLPETVPPFMSPILGF